MSRIKRKEVRKILPIRHLIRTLCQLEEERFVCVRINDEDYIIKNIEKELKATDNPQDWYYVLKAEKK